MGNLADDTRWLDATEQAELVRRKDVTAVELLEAAIERIEATDPAINAVVLRWFDEARETAAAIDARSGRGVDGVFAGVPFLLKDLWATYAGQPMSNGNAAMKATMPVADADTTLVGRFRDAGLVTAGRTNSPELGSVPTTEPAAWGPTHNPWDVTRTPGGSSGGAAAAVAAGMVPIAHASDGGGSIRIPASCCGLVGLKPSQGRITLGPTRDESGLSVELCVSRTVRDTAAMLDAVRGPGVGDTVIAPPPDRPYVDELGADPGRLRIGLLDHHPLGVDIDAECTNGARAAAALLESLGHHVEESFPAPLADPESARRFNALWATNMSASIVRIGELIGRPVTEADVEPFNWVLATNGRALPAPDYALALSASAVFRRGVQQWWADGFDLLVSPTLGDPPPKLGELGFDPADPQAYGRRVGRFVPFTTAFNVSGLPAISLPLHRTPDGLPVGIQLVAAYGREDVLIRVASQLEQASPWAHLRPTI
ncbi:amidase [Desertimonas flava]|uniref:amidase n=1 Tax=Desertimonas flava TaxID=2064846 RepID=UPI000E3440B9|nr:amidase [Desertimonas flava]